MADFLVEIDYKEEIISMEYQSTRTKQIPKISPDNQTNGASSDSGSSRLVLTSSDKQQYTYALRFCFSASNNEAGSHPLFPRSWEEIPSFTITAERHYKVAEVLVKEGAVIEPGTRVVTLDILEEEERPKSSTRSTQSDTSESHQSKAVSHDDSAPPNKKQKVQVSFSLYLPMF
nr:hypothetical protein [Tanacetum cinerariifolium]